MDNNATLNSMKPIKRKFHVKVRSFFHRKVKGLIDPIIYDDTICPSADWTPYLGATYELKQKFGNWETNDCWCFSPSKVCIDVQLNALWPQFSQEAKTFFINNGITSQAGLFNLSERAYGILGGNKNNGGTAEELFQLIQSYGLIPFSALNYTDTQANAQPTYQAFLNDYFNPNAITQAMLDIGTQSKKYFNLQYQRIGMAWQTPSKAILTGAMQQAPLAYGVPVNPAVWNQQNTSLVNVPAYAKVELDHEVGGYKMSLSQVGYPIVDNYVPFLKVLDDGYGIYSCMQAVITIPQSTVPISQPITGLQKFWNQFMAFLYQYGFITPQPSPSQ